MQDDPETYQRYAEECQKLAKMMPIEHRPTLLAMAQCWIELAHKAADSKTRLE
jgi:hypothetical protein